MKNKSLLFLIFSLGVIAIAEFAVIFTTVSPLKATLQDLWIFYLSLLLSASSILCFIFYWAKHIFASSKSSVSVLVSLRQAFLISLVTVLCLFFKSLNLLNFWEILPLFISVILIEFFFQADKNPQVETTI